jgi:hypothetical protein
VHHVELPNLEVSSFNPFHQVRSDIAGDDVTRRPDALRKPLRKRAIPSADLEAMPARGHARHQQMKAARRIEQIRHQPQPVAFALEVVLPNIHGHGLRISVIADWRSRSAHALAASRYRGREELGGGFKR